MHKRPTFDLIGKKVGCWPLTSRPLPHTHSRMRKGWLTSVRTSFSLWTCCSCFSRITSGIFICFSAKKDLLFLSLTRKTRPNVPVPAFKWDERRGSAEILSSLKWKQEDKEEESFSWKKKKCTWNCDRSWMVFCYQNLANKCFLRRQCVKIEDICIIAYLRSSGICVPVFRKVCNVWLSLNNVVDVACK